MTNVRFYVGLHQPSDARHFDRCCISVNRLRPRKSFKVSDWIMDSGAFTEISRHGHYRYDVKSYAAEIARWANVGQLDAAVSQDWMCEPFILKKTGFTVAQHQRFTVERYDALLQFGLPAYVLPVLQGFDPADYARHIEMYGARLAPSAWVGVGSVCKRNATPVDIVHVLATIKAAREDLRLHGFGLKKTALMDPTVRALLHSADSMAWSFHARRNGGNANDWRQARVFVDEVERETTKPREYWQPSLVLERSA